MNRLLVLGGLLFVVVAASGPYAQVRLTASAQATAVKTPDTTSTATNDQALVDKYCVTCHNARTLSGNLSLAGLDVARKGAGRGRRAVGLFRLGGVDAAHGQERRQAQEAHGGHEDGEQHLEQREAGTIPGARPSLTRRVSVNKARGSELVMRHVSGLPC